MSAQTACSREEPVPKSGPEGGAGDQHTALAEGLLVEDELLVTAPGGEEPVLETGAADPLEVHRGDDLVSVHVGPAEGDADARVGGERFHVELLTDQVCGAE